MNNPFQIPIDIPIAPNFEAILDPELRDLLVPEMPGTKIAYFTTDVLLAQLIVTLRKLITSIDALQPPPPR